MKPLIYSAFVLAAITVPVSVSGQDKVSVGETKTSWCGVCADQPELNRASSNHLSEVFNHARVNPLVIKRGTDTFNFEIGVVDTNVTSLHATRSLNSRIYRNAPGQEIPFYDDGSHGDRVADDKIFTTDKLVVEENDLMGKNHFGAERALLASHLGFEFVLEFQDGPVDTVQLGRFDHNYAIRTIDPARVPIPTVHQISDSVFATDYAVCIVLPDVIGEFPNQGFGDSKLECCAAFQRFYSHFADDRDFIIAQSLLLWGRSGIQGLGGAVANSIQGIGERIFDNTERLYSSGRLQGTISLLDDEFNPFAFRIITHEILHRWAVRLDPSLELNFTYGSHWDYVERPSTDFGDGSNRLVVSITMETDSTYLAVSNTFINPNHYVRDAQRYNDLELYIMGLIAPDEIDSPVRVLLNPQPLGQQRYRADGIREVTTDEILSVMGSRIPNHTESQKEFTAAMIIPYDRPLSDIEMAYFDFRMREYEKPSSNMGYGLTFEEATGGRATISTKLNLTPVSVANDSKGLPEQFSLSQNYPNPFNPTTTIRYSLRQPEQVVIKLFDLLGRKVETLLEQRQIAGNYSLEFNAKNISSGLYFYRMQAGSYFETRKLIVLK